MSNSALATYKKLSPHCTKPRKGEIKGVAIHCMAGNLSVEGCGQVFQTREASSHYGIGSDGRIGQYVDEVNRAWCTSNTIDHNLVTIEVANLITTEPFTVSDAAYRSLINLLVDICQRNHIKQLLWKGDKSLMGNWSKQNMVVHRWTAAKSCPGNYLYGKHGEIAAEVNKRLSGTAEAPAKAPETKKEEDTVTQAQFNAMMDAWLKEQANKPEPEWSRKEGAFAKAAASGVMDGTRPESPVKRDELAAILDRKGLL